MCRYGYPLPKRRYTKGRYYTLSDGIRYKCMQASPQMNFLPNGYIERYWTFGFVGGGRQCGFDSFERLRIKVNWEDWEKDAS